MKPEFISFYYHLVIAFVLAVAFFYGIKWLASIKRKDNLSAFWPLVINIVRRPLLTIPWVLFFLYSAHFWPGLEGVAFNDTLNLIQKIIFTI